MNFKFDVRLLIHPKVEGRSYSWSIDIDENAYDAMDEFNRTGHAEIWQDVSVHWGKLNHTVNAMDLSDEVISTRRVIAIAEEKERIKVKNSA